MRLTRVPQGFVVCLGAVVFGLSLPAFAAAAEAPGIVHVVTEPAYGQWHVVQEVWFNRDGSGWRMRQTGGTGETNWVADRRGMRIVISDGSRGGPAGTDFIAREDLAGDYLTRPWVDLAIDPLARVARGEMKVVGETTVDGEAAYELVYTDSKHDGSGLFFAAKDDGALLQARTSNGGVVNIQTYEVLPPTFTTGRTVTPRMRTGKSGRDRLDLTQRRGTARLH